MLRMLRFINYIFFCYVKPGANGRNIVANNFQHCSMLHVASICTPCCMLLRFVGICCVKSETGQTLSYMQTDATTPNNVGSCWPTMLRPIAPGFTFLYYIFLEFVNDKSYVQTDATTPNIVAGNFAQQLPTTHNNMQQPPTTCNIQQFWELLVNNNNNNNNNNNTKKFHWQQC